MQTRSLLAALALTLSALAAPAQVQGIKLGSDGEAWRLLEDAKPLKVMFLRGVYEGLFFGASPATDAYPTTTSWETLADGLDEFYAEAANRGVLVVWALQVLKVKLERKSEDEVKRATRYNRCRSAAFRSGLVDETRRRIAACASEH